MNILLPVLFSLPFLVVGIFLLRAGKAYLSLARASRSWPSLIGTVQSLTPIRAGDYHRGFFDGAEFGNQLYVRYSYELAGQRHWGDWKSPSASSLKKAIARCGLKESGPITVYYDPQNPARSVGTRGFTFERLVRTFVGLAFLIIPLPLALTAAMAFAQQ